MWFVLPRSGNIEDLDEASRPMITIARGAGKSSDTSENFLRQIKKKTLFTLSNLTITCLLRCLNVCRNIYSSRVQTRWFSTSSTWLIICFQFWPIRLIQSELLLCSGDFFTGNQSRNVIYKKVCYLKRYYLLVLFCSKIAVLIKIVFLYLLSCLTFEWIK